MRSTLPLRLFAVLSLIGSSLALAPAAAAHGHLHIGEYEVVIGWLNEPTFVGQPNGVEITITDHEGNPVTDLADGDLQVVVSTAGVDSPVLSLSPGFSLTGGFGTPGQYDVELVPTAPGEYTFHFTGSIHDQAVDVSMTSGEDAFGVVRTSTDIEFPIKNPTLADVATRLDRIDGRIETLQADLPSAADVDALQTAVSNANAAAAAAERTAFLGLFVGAAGLLFGWISLRMALRARRGAGPA